MATLQYMASSHGISKRFRLSNELSETTFKEIDEISFPVVVKGLQQTEPVKEYNNTKYTFLRSDQLKDLQDNSCHVAVADSCIGSSIKYSPEKCNSVKKFINSKGTDMIVVKRTFISESDQSLNDHTETNSKTINQETEQEPPRTLSHQISKDEEESSIDSVEDEFSNVLNETCNNSKESIKKKQISGENLGLVPCKDSCANQLKKYGKLKSIQQEHTNKIAVTSGGFYYETELYNDSGVSVDESSNSLSLKDIGGFSDVLKTNKLCQIDKLENQNHIESELKKINLNESRQYSKNYQMFSDVIQKARNKVKPRTKCDQPSINATEQNAVLVNNLYPIKLSKSSKVLKENPLTYKLSTYLWDMEELEDFLDFCNDEISQMMAHFFDVTRLLHFFSRQVEYIEIILLETKSTEFIAEKNVGNEDFKLTIQNLVNRLLEDIIESSRTWRYASDIYKMNLDILIDTMFNFCSTAIESEIFDNSDLVYNVFKEIQSELRSTQLIQSQVRILFYTERAKLEGICEDIARLRQMSNTMSPSH